MVPSYSLDNLVINQKTTESRKNKINEEYILLIPVLFWLITYIFVCKLINLRTKTKLSTKKSEL